MLEALKEESVGFLFNVTVEAAPAAPSDATPAADEPAADKTVVETAALVEAVKRVALVAERNTPVRLRFTDGQLAIEAGAGDDAQASEAVPCTMTGPELEIGFNPHFLLDGLGALGTSHCRLQFTQPSRPAVLVGQADADAEPDMSYRYVLMPVRFPA